MLPPVLAATADLLTSPAALARVRICAAADRCAWLFLDTSRNATRRWCDMTLCGNRAKARRHYARTTAAATRREPLRNRRGSSSV
jgi:predicted RNA-binding Zn ribbon-like protein